MSSPKRGRFRPSALGLNHARLGAPAGDTDATVLLKQQSGSRRWQHLALGAAAAAAANGQPAAGRGSPVEQNYTIILGSHRNSCLKFEKDGELCCMVRGAALPTATSQVHANVAGRHCRLLYCAVSQRKPSLHTAS